MNPKRPITYVFFFILLMGISPFVHAVEDSVKVDSTVHDTVVFSNSNVLQGMMPVTDKTNLEKHLIQAPTTALFKSMVVPGWGQWGNKKYIKAIIFASFDTWMIARAIHYKKTARDLFDQFESASDVSTRNYYYDLYSHQRDQRNKYTWFAVITSFFSMFDAYVDAHLSGYPSEKNEGNDVKIGVVPTDYNGAMVSLSLSF